MSDQRDIDILRDLVRQLKDITSQECMDQRRELWREHNTFRRVGVPIYIREGVYLDEVVNPLLECGDPFFRAHEREIRCKIFQDSLEDDYVIEPWITQHASFVLPPGGHWGVQSQGSVTRSEVEGGAFHQEATIKDPQDAERMIRPRHRIDEAATARNIDRIREAVGDIIEVDVDRSPVWRHWNADMSTDLGYLRGIEQLMWDMSDRPEWLHGLLSFMRDGILEAQQQAEEAGDWRLSNHENQSMPYAEGLQDRRANGPPVTRDQLWVFMAAQEFTLISPEMHYEFMLQYQIPIIEKFALSSYGCCEDLSNKMDMVRRIPNLRRIAIAPVANIQRCAEQIGDEYICSYRPCPARTVCVGWSPDNVRRLIREDLAVFKANGCFVDVCLKDIQTVQHEPRRLREFVRIVREEAQGY